jgi:hypothetical protein
MHLWITGRETKTPHFVLHVVFSLDKKSRSKIFLHPFERHWKWMESGKIFHLKKFFHMMQQKKSTNFRKSNPQGILSIIHLNDDVVNMQPTPQ